MKRLFIALPIPATISEVLSQQMSSLVRRLPNARVIPVENWHVTMRFLGDCNEEDGDTLGSILRETAKRHDAPMLSVRSLRYGPPGPVARMVWAVGSSQPLIPIRETLDWMIRESRIAVEANTWPLKLHITLARFSRVTPIATLPPIQEKAASNGTIDHIMLMESFREPEGSRYECLASAYFRDREITAQ
jgi:2'-5' RNA ligase